MSPLLLQEGVPHPQGGGNHLEGVDLCPGRLMEDPGEQQQGQMKEGSRMIGTGRHQGRLWSGLVEQVLLVPEIALAGLALGVLHAILPDESAIAGLAPGALLHGILTVGRITHPIDGHLHQDIGQGEIVHPEDVLGPLHPTELLVLESQETICSLQVSVLLPLKEI